MITFWMMFNLVLGLLNVLAVESLVNHTIGSFNLLGAGMLLGVMATEWVEGR